jgi:hypothetical protein
MTSPKLPKGAFLPKRGGDESEHATFVLHRNRLFEQCTAREKECLVELARWYGGLRLDVLAKPNLFSESSRVCVMYRAFPWANTKPNVVIYGLAKIHDLIFYKIDRWLGWKAHAELVPRIRSLVRDDEIEVLFGVITFVRKLPLQFAIEGKSEFNTQLTALVGERIHNKGVPAVRRFDAVLRGVARSYEEGGFGSDLADLRKQAWPILLDVAREDMKAAVSLVDDHWNQTRAPQLLMTLHLHERPELAYQLAVTIKPQNIRFAMDMLRVLIFDATYQAKKLDAAAAAVLEKIIETSCCLLAEWALEVAEALPQDALNSIDRLLRFGSPRSDYWSKLLPKALALIQCLTPDEQDKQLQLIAQVAFYCPGTALADDAQAIFETALTRRLNASSDDEWSFGSTISDVSRSLSILEDKTMSSRNRFFSARPDHPLLQTAKAQLEIFLKRLQASAPARALSNLVALMLALSNEVLIREHHHILRAEFEVRAREYPVDAGLAMQKLIKYCGFSQVDDEMYRRTLCQESFKALIPMLEAISPADAAVARSGIGWSPSSGRD